MTSALTFAVRGSEGMFVYKGIDENRKSVLQAVNSSEQPSNCRVFCFSADGSMFAYCDGNKTALVETSSMKELWTVPLTKLVYLKFSPKGTFLMAWQAYTTAKEGEKGENNMKMFRTCNGELAWSYINKSHRDWAPRFTEDEVLCARLAGSELLIHANGNFEKYENKHVVPNMADFSIGTGGAPYNIACYVPPVKGQAAKVSIHRYPDMVAKGSKSFWKADRVSFFWNKKGSAVIVMAVTDTDSTGASYYGESNLYLMHLATQDSCLLPLGKKGPVYAIDWNPNSAEFCVVYGYMPARATLYNIKGEPTFDFGEGPRNECYYNAFGSIVTLCGFGNLRGNIEMWCVKDRKRIKQYKAEDTTLFLWAPDGKHFLTATTAPRLRVSNGYKMWDYHGNELWSVPTPPPKELWEVMWKPVAHDIYSNFQIAYPSVEEEAQKAYVPPHLRGKGPAPNVRGSVQDAINSPVYSKHRTIPGMPTQESKRRGPGGRHDGALLPAHNAPVDPAVEAEKRRRNLIKKLEKIEVLRQKVAAGENIEKTQMEMMSKEGELKEELSRLEALKLIIVLCQMYNRGKFDYLKSTAEVVQLCRVQAMTGKRDLSNDGEGPKKKKAGKKKAKSKKISKFNKEEGMAVPNSDDEEEEGEGVDYMSDSEDSAVQEIERKVFENEDMVDIVDETELRTLLSDEEEEENVVESLEKVCRCRSGRTGHEKKIKRTRK